MSSQYLHSVILIVDSAFFGRSEILPMEMVAAGTGILVEVQLALGEFFVAFRSDETRVEATCRWAAAVPRQHDSNLPNSVGYRQ